VGRAHAFALVSDVSGVARPKVRNFPHGETKWVCMSPASRGGGTKFRPWSSCRTRTGGTTGEYVVAVFVQVNPARGTRPWSAENSSRRRLARGQKPTPGPVRLG